MTTRDEIDEGEIACHIHGLLPPVPIRTDSDIVNKVILADVVLPI